MKKHIFTREIEFLEEILEVEFTAEMLPQNDGIGSYEFWGSQQFDAGKDYWIIDKIQWNQDIYTKEKNDAISDYIDENWLDIEEAEGDAYAESIGPDPDDYDEEDRY